MISLAGVSAITFAVLYGLLGLILITISFLGGMSVWGALLVMLIVVLVQYLISPWLTDLTQKWFYKTRFDVEMPAYVTEFVHQVCAENKMKMPRMGFIDDGAPNAFTYGHTKNDARIVLTRGIFDLLTEDEVKAVIGHELGHAVHYDILLMTMVQLVPMVLYAIYDVLTNVSKSNSSSDNKGQAAVAIVAAIAYILYIVCQYVILWFSRVREYYADEFSARSTGSANALASALVNIGFGLSTRQNQEDAGKVARSTSTLGIFDGKASKSLVVNCYEDGKVNPAQIKNAMRWEMWNVWAFWYELGSTHPLTAKRINALSKISAELGETPLVEYNEEKPESYVDDFIREVIVDILPALVLTVGIIVSVVMLAMETPLALPVACVLLLAAVLASIFKFLFTHPRKEYHEANVAGLLGEVKVSMVKSIPCSLRGTIIGRGDPGCIFNEDYVIRDNTGIMFLDYNQPLWIINKVFALFKSGQNVGKQVEIKGWYRRNMVPFVELYSYTIDGVTKKCYSYGFGWAWRLILLVLTLALCALVFLGILG